MHPQQAQHKQQGRQRVCFQLGGEPYKKGENVWMTEKRPIKLQRVFIDLEIIAGDVGKNITNKKGHTLSRSTISQTLSRGYIPAASTPDFEVQMEAYLRTLGVSEAQIATCWEPEEKGNIVPFGAGTGRKKKALTVVKPTPEQLFEEQLKEAEVLTPTAKKHFRLFTNPFVDDVQQDADVFVSESFLYVLEAMKDAASRGGVCAIIAEVGAGKTTVRKLLSQRLDDDVRIIFPQTIDKKYLTSNQILEAIINDLSPGVKVSRTNEAKARQVRALLLDSSRAGMRHVLMIEEAHDLPQTTLRQLKRLSEIEDGYKKMLGIVLVGQSELDYILDARTNPQIREFIHRCQKSHLSPLDNDLEAYIEHKFNRVNKAVSEVLAEGWADALRNRLTINNGRDSISKVYPLYVQNHLVAAMNLAAQMGEPLVTAEIITEA